VTGCPEKGSFRKPLGDVSEVTMNQQLHTVQQAAIASGLSEGCIRNLLTRRRIKVHRLGRSIYIETAVVEQLKRRNRA
jgi:hypothetical protein